MPNKLVLKKLLQKYNLCDPCLKRQFPLEEESNLLMYKIKTNNINDNEISDEKCYICGGLMSSVNKYTDMIISSLNDYQQESFSIGSRVSTSIIEKEDDLRSFAKLKGGQNFKTHFSRELNNSLSKRLNLKPNYKNPDLMIIVDTLLERIEVSTKSIYVFGRYKKTKRGLDQKRKRCLNCRGKGCSECHLIGFIDKASVEENLMLPLVSLFKAKKTKFTWIGSEDKQSLVLGEGRPFYAEIIEPKVRFPSNLFSIKASNGVSVKMIRILDVKPNNNIKFKVSVKCNCRADSAITKKDIDKLEKQFNGSIVKMLSNNRNRHLLKTIHSFNVNSVKGLSLVINIECDGGLNIRSLVTGEGTEVTPNIASTLKRRITLDEKKPFDVLNVNYSEYQ
ncbi:MAG TPA: tRNA pseudouridine(54/55) synthase Pus10 [Nitrososphaerales archaeon]